MRLDGPGWRGSDAWAWFPAGRKASGDQKGMRSGLILSGGLMPQPPPRL